MCMSCGCLNPTDSHGDERNITVNHLREAANAQKIGLMDVIKNFIKTLPVVIKNWHTYAASADLEKK